MSKDRFGLSATQVDAVREGGVNEAKKPRNTIRQGESYS